MRKEGSRVAHKGSLAESHLGEKAFCIRNEGRGERDTKSLPDSTKPRKYRYEGGEKGTANVGFSNVQTTPNSSLSFALR